MMKFQRFLYHFFILLFSLSYFSSSCEANKFLVGYKDGWVLKPSEDYNHWAERNRFQVNDSLVFTYKKGSDSVLVVNKSDYDNCNTKNPIKKMEDGNSEFKFDRSGLFYFISGIHDHCAKEQKLIVLVLAVRQSTKPNPPSPSIPKAPVPQVQPPIANPPKGFEPISPYPKSPSPSITTPPTPQAQPPVANPPKGFEPISPNPKSHAPSPASSPGFTPISPSPSPSPYAITPSSPSSSPVAAPSGPISPTPTSQPPTTPRSISPAPESSIGSPPSPGDLTPAPSGGSPTNSSSPQASQNQKSYAITVTPASFLVLSITILVTIVLSPLLGGGI